MTRGSLTRERDLRAAYAAHSGELYGFATRTLGDAGLAEEAVEETFVRAWKARDRFGPKTSTFRTWLFSILREVVIELSRDRATVEPPGRRQLAWQIEEAMRRISPEDRRILLETCHRGRAYAELATDLGIPETSMRSRIYDALRAVQEALVEVKFDT